mgnify:FL=1
MKQLNIPLVIQNLDLSFIEFFYKNKDLCFLNDVKEYKEFLTLKIMDIHDCVEPSENVLIIWKYHILHTKRYLADCDLIFGKTIFINEKLLKKSTKLQ